jgi:hypothetical protein
MNHIVQHGKIIHQSRNQRGIRRYAGTHIAECIHLYHYQDGSGLLEVEFADYATGLVAFCSFETLKYVVANWRNLRGVPVIKYFVNRGHRTTDGFINP